MNDKYLWDKSGSDAEIEELEEMLSVFRHQGEAPAIATPRNVVAFPARRVGRGNILAIAASFAIAALAGVWFMQSRPGAEVATDDVPAQIRTADIQQTLQTDEIVAANNDGKSEPTLKASKVRTAAIKPKTLKASYMTSKRSRTLQDSPTLAKLTREEQFAYDQLLLALSITSSKLQVVRDTISRTDTNTDRADR